MASGSAITTHWKGSQTGGDFIPAWAVLRVALIVFTVESLLMLALPIVAPVLQHAGIDPVWGFAALDAILLILVTSPFVYLWVVHPFITARSHAEAGLERSERVLRERVAELEEVQRHLETQGEEMLRKEAALSASEQRLRDMAESTSDWLWEMDADLRFTYHSRRLKEVTGIDPKTLLGMTRRDLSKDTADDEAWHRHYADLDARRPFRDWRYKHVTPDGRILHFSVNGKPVFDDAGCFMGYRGTGSDITAQIESEMRLRESEARFRAIVDNSPAKIHIKDLDGRYLMINRVSEELFGVTDAEARGQTSKDIFPETTAAAFGAHDRAVIESGQAIEQEEEWEREDGLHTYLTVKFPFTGADGKVVAVGAIGTDITERKVAEARLRQALKMEAVGQLTSGVAHDFNNLLAVVLGNLQLIEKHLGDDERQANRVATAIDATQRGAELVKRLLAYSRQTVLAPQDLDVNKLVSGMTDLIRRTLGETIDIELKLADDLEPTNIDPGQLDNALLNLAVNARDAMPDGGRLTIETANVDVDDKYAAAHTGMVSGRYVVLTVADTGTGMPPAVLKRVFEPFYTTKEVGKGTGLGLSMVYGFAKQSGAYVDIRSELGHGTVVDLYLPAAEPSDAAAPKELEKTGAAPGSHETILVVEDEAGVRDTAVALLEDMNYRVLQAENGPAALAILMEHDDIDLLFTDVVMPGGMNGFELVREVRQRHHGIGVLYASGHAEEVLKGHERLDGDNKLIGKPYQKEDLASGIRDALDRRAS